MQTFDNLQRLNAKARKLLQEPILFEGHIRKLHYMLTFLLPLSENEAESLNDIEQGYHHDLATAQFFLAKTKQLLALIENYKVPSCPADLSAVTSSNSYLPYLAQNKILPKLPNEILSHIFSYLTSHEKMNLRLVCKEWDNVIYHTIPSESYMVLPKPVLGYMILNLKSANRPAVLGKIFNELYRLLNAAPQQLKNSAREEVDNLLESQLSHHANTHYQAHTYSRMLICMLFALAGGVAFFVALSYKPQYSIGKMFIPLYLTSSGLLFVCCCSIGCCMKKSASPATERELQDFSTSLSYKTFRLFKTLKASHEVSSYLGHVAKSFSGDYSVSPPAESHDQSSSYDPDEALLPLVTRAATNFWQPGST